MANIIFVVLAVCLLAIVGINGKAIIPLSMYPGMTSNPCFDTINPCQTDFTGGWTSGGCDGANICPQEYDQGGLISSFGNGNYIGGGVYGQMPFAYPADYGFGSAFQMGGLAGFGGIGNPYGATGYMPMNPFYTTYGGPMTTNYGTEIKMSPYNWRDAKPKISTAENTNSIALANRPSVKPLSKPVPQVSKVTVVDEKSEEQPNTEEEKDDSDE